MRKRSNPHDVFFRHALGQKDNAISMLRGVLPKELSEQLDYDNLTLSADTFTTPDMRKFMSDLVYEAPLLGPKSRRLTVSLLVEHKSFPPRQPIQLQLARYFLGAVESQIKQGKKPPSLPVMVVIYHGKRPYAKKGFHEFFGHLPDFLLPYVPEFEHILVNLSHYDDQRLQDQFDSLKLRVALLALRDVFDKRGMGDKFILYLEELSLRYDLHTATEEALMVLGYLEAAAPEHYLRIQTDFEERKEKHQMTFLEKAIRQAKQDGIDIGIEKGIDIGIEQGIDIERRNSDAQVKLVRVRSAIALFLKGFPAEPLRAMLQLSDDLVLLAQSMVAKHGQLANERVGIRDFQVVEIGPGQPEQDQADQEAVGE